MQLKHLEELQPFGTRKKMHQDSKQQLMIHYIPPLPSSRVKRCRDGTPGKHFKPQRRTGVAPHNILEMTLCLSS